ncbi:MAG: type IV pili methyl-accepting chemotaxis transducer N-terminal domain-containing protein [Pseudomonadota bacterium]
MYKTFLVCCGLSLSSGAFATSVMAGEAEVIPASTFAEDTGDVLRIEAAEYLRIYSQEVAAAACFLYNDIDPSLSRELLIESRKGFDKKWNALVSGDETLGIIGGEKRRKTIAKLENVGAVWSGMATAVDALIADATDSNAVNVIKSTNMELFELTDILVTEVSAEYSNPSVIVQADVLKLEIVGRQAMMTQKIAKDACKIFTGNTDQVLKENLTRSMAIYDASLDALLNGMPSLGLQPAPTPEIAASLESIKADWSGTRPILDALVTGATVSDDQKVYLFKHMVEEMVRLEELSHAYVDHSQHNY